MMTYSLLMPDGEVVISLNATKIDQTAPLLYVGSAKAVETITRWLSQQYGIYGHLIDDATTPLDLAHVMQGEAAQPFEPVLTAGKAILEQKPTPPERGSVY